MSAGADIIVTGNVTERAMLNKGLPKSSGQLKALKFDASVKLEILFLFLESQNNPLLYMLPWEVAL